MRPTNINWVLCILLILTFVKGIIWAGVIPAWQAPDEQNHFSLIQFYAESKKLAVDPDFDNTVSKELITTTSLMNLDWSGAHPMWRPEFSNTSTGSYEEKISRIDKKDRQNFLFNANGRKSPPFYYYLSAIVYLAFSHFDILIRLFILRFLSVLIGVLTVFFTYLFVKEIYPRKQLLALTSATLVSFHPSFNFVTSTVTVDSMVILLTTVFVYLGVRYLKTKESRPKNIFWLLIIILFGVLTKASLIPLVAVLFIFVGFRKIKEKKITRQSVELAMLFTLLLTLYLVSSSSFSFLQDFVGFFTLLMNANFFSSLINFLNKAVYHYYSQVFGWYWGVFGWLEVSLPVNFYRILKILTIIAFLSLVIATYRRLREKKLNNFGIGLFILSILVFLHASILFFDWQTFARTGSLFGFQGRHFLAPVAIHMFLLSLGLTIFLKFYQQKFMLILLILFFIFTNLFSIYQILHYFYYPRNLLELSIYISQYKPIFLKAPFLFGYSLFYIILLVVYIFQIFLCFFKNRTLE